jgi:hypothetical protein
MRLLEADIDGSSAKPRQWIGLVVIVLLVFFAALCVMPIGNLAAALGGMDRADEAFGPVQVKETGFFAVWLICEMIALVLLVSRMRIGEDNSLMLRLVARVLIAVSVLALSTVCLTIFAWVLGWGR